MQKQDWITLVRTLLIGLGSWLYGKNIGGTALDATAWQEIVGAVVALGSAVWGIVDKTSGIEQFQSAFRSALTILGGYLVGAGTLTADKWTQIMNASPVIIAFIFSYLDKQKTKQIIDGKILPTNLVTPTTAAKKPINKP